MTNSNLRAFVGLPVVDPMLKELDSLASQLAGLDGNRMSWVPRENYHITLLFLDEQSPQWLEEFAEAIDEEISFEPLEISLSRITPFPEGSPKLLVAMVDKNEQLLDLHHDLKRLARQLGFQPEKRRFKPHITLARKFPRFGQHLMPPAVNKVSMYASEMVIYESQLRQSGARYYPLYGFGSQEEDIQWAQAL